MVCWYRTHHQVVSDASWLATYTSIVDEAQQESCTYETDHSGMISKNACFDVVSEAYTTPAGSLEANLICNAAEILDQGETTITHLADQ